MAKENDNNIPTLPPAALAVTYDNVLSDENQAKLYVARQTRLEALKSGLLMKPNDSETRFAKRLVNHALYTTWLDIQKSQRQQKPEGSLGTSGTLYSKFSGQKPR